MSAQPKLKYTLDEYLKLDFESEARLEYWDGEIFDMSGSSPQHDQLEGNLYVGLRAKLKGRSCRAFLANTRIKVPSAPPYRYGDISAVCSDPRFEAIGGVEALTNPALIIEVLSKSTEAYDRGDKFSHYKSIPNFKEYLLVAQHRVHVTHLVKQADGSWNQREYNDLEAVIKLVSLDCEIAMTEIYEAVTFEPQPTSLHPLA